jgi:hypothetical protein
LQAVARATGSDLAWIIGKFPENVRANCRGLELLPLPRWEIRGLGENNP